MGLLGLGEIFLKLQLGSVFKRPKDHLQRLACSRNFTHEHVLFRVNQKLAATGDNVAGHVLVLFAKFDNVLWMHHQVFGAVEIPNRGMRADLG